MQQEGGEGAAETEEESVLDLAGADELWSYVIGDNLHDINDLLCLRVTCRRLLDLVRKHARRILWVWDGWGSMGMPARVLQTFPSADTARVYWRGDDAELDTGRLLRPYRDLVLAIHPPNAGLRPYEWQRARWGRPAGTPGVPVGIWGSVGYRGALGARGLYDATRPCAWRWPSALRRFVIRLLAMTAAATGSCRSVSVINCRDIHRRMVGLRGRALSLFVDAFPDGELDDAIAEVCATAAPNRLDVCAPFPLPIDLFQAAF